MELPVYYGRTKVGCLHLTPQGDQRMKAEMSAERDDSGLFRGYLVCRKGEFPLGVLEPRDGSLLLRRMLLKGELQALGEPVEGQMRLSFAFAAEAPWRPVERSEAFFARPPFQGRLQGMEGLLWRRERGLRCLAIPYRADRPFPMTDLFCFARIQPLEGRPYVVLAFNEREEPVMVKSPGKKPGKS